MVLFSYFLIWNVAAFLAQLLDLQQELYLW